MDDVLVGVEQPPNITNSSGVIDEGPDWSPDGESIVYTTTPTRIILSFPMGGIYFDTATFIALLAMA